MQIPVQTVSDYELPAVTCFLTTKNQEMRHEFTIQSLKRSVTVWKKPEETAAKKAKIQHFIGKITATVFWD